jgi:YD repeat-containing protein
MSRSVARALASIATSLAVVAALAAAAPAAALDDPQQVALALDRPAFSPNGDDVADTATAIAIVATDVAGAVLTLEVLDTAGALVNTLLAAVPVPPGETTATWRGLDDANRKAPDGVYTIRATVVDASAVSITAEAALVLDTVAPNVHWRSIAPQPIRSRAATVRISFRLAGAEQGKLLVTDAAGTIVHRGAWDGSGGLVTRTWNLRDERRERVPPGLYWVRVTARDAAGNVGATRRAPCATSTRSRHRS